MNWFFEENNRRSKKNGKIRVLRQLGDWYVSVDNIGQTSPYLRAMWSEAFKKLKKLNPARVQKVLMLGLGAGGEIKTIYKNFPEISLTVVEYDPEMIRLAEELNLHRPYPLPSIILGDAAQIVPTLEETFDLIIYDLFLGAAASPLITEKSFMKSLHERLNLNGSLLVNAYKNVAYLDQPVPYFEHEKKWVFRLNTLGLFSKPKKII